MRIYIFFFVFSLPLFAQQDSIPQVVEDTTKVYVMYLDEVDLFGDSDAMLEYKRLKRRVYKVYGFAKLTAANLDKIDKTMAALKSNKDKRKYFKIAEKYMTDHFEPRLKKLSYNDAMVLIKLIHRQTGTTTYELIKDYKSGFKAVISNTTARVFGLNLKKEFQPISVKEDFLIEKILQEAFLERRLIEQKPAFEIDYPALEDKWKLN